jgi:hypothetical protein
MEIRLGKETVDHDGSCTERCEIPKDWLRFSQLYIEIACFDKNRTNAFVLEWLCYFMLISLPNLHINTERT